jgi:DNA-binding PadR family transcriptional regulator
MKKHKKLDLAAFRISVVEERILQLLSKPDPRPMYGLELVEASRGALKRGTIYTSLQRMVSKGLVQVSELETAAEYGDIRRGYRATDRGLRALEAAALTRRIMEGR